MQERPYNEKATKSKQLCIHNIRSKLPGVNAQKLAGPVEYSDMLSDVHSICQYHQLVSVLCHGLLWQGMKEGCVLTDIWVYTVRLTDIFV